MCESIFTVYDPDGMFSQTVGFVKIYSIATSPGYIFVIKWRYVPRNNIRLRGCLHVNFIPRWNHPCIWRNVSYCLHVFAEMKSHPGMKNEKKTYKHFILGFLLYLLFSLGSLEKIEISFCFKDKINPLQLFLFTDVIRCSRLLLWVDYFIYFEFTRVSSIVYQSQHL